MKMTNITFRMLGTLTAILVFTASCNKDMEQFPDIAQPQPTGPRLDQVLQSNANDNLFYLLMERGGLLPMISDSNKRFTIFATANTGVKPVLSALSQGLVPPNAPDAAFVALISQIPVAQAAALVQYNILPQEIRSSSIAPVFPNFSYPSTYNPAPSVSPLLRLNTYPAISNGRPWLNNIPIIGVDELAYNGVIHHTAVLSVPNPRTLWQRISAESDLTYLEAAILRADSGVAPNQTLQYYLSNFGPNFTVFAPVDTAFQTTLKGLILQGLLAQNVPLQIALPLATQFSSTPDVFTNPLLATQLTPQTVKGLLVYHVLGSRAFTNNFPVNETAYPTLLNSVLSAHPGIKLKANYTPPSPFVTSATVKDVYNNSPAANVFINAQPLTPDPLGTSDQNFINGVLHKIDKVLLPQ